MQRSDPKKQPKKHGQNNSSQEARIEGSGWWAK